MDNQLKKLTQQVVDMVEEGYDKTAIIKKLSINTLPKDLAKSLLFKIDDLIVEQELESQKSNSLSTKMALGAFALVLGILLKFITNLSGFQSILSYASILFGVWLLRNGYKESKQIANNKKQRISKNQRFKKY